MSSSKPEQKALVEQAVENGTRRYIQSRRDMIERFVERNYSFSGALELNKKAFGLDMLKTPANILWTPPYFLLSGTGRLMKKLTKDKVGQGLSTLPAGFQTDVEKEVVWRLHSQLLELPYREGDREGDREFKDNRLFEMILAEESLTSIFEPGLKALAALEGDEAGKARLESNLTAYVDSRKAAAELSSAMISMAAGYVANKSINFGAMGLGSAVATSLAHHAAVSSFVFGNTLGSMYYSVFSVTVSKTAVALSTGGIAVALGIIASYTGVVTDPLQKSLGLHQKKLHKIIDALEQQLLGDDENAVSFKDGYVARVMDVADIMLTLALK